MAPVKENLRRVLAALPAEGVTLVAVSKFHPAEAIAEAYAEGQRDFGESRANELTGKVAALPDDIRWHFIGHLQTNKVRPVVAASSLIHSVDSERLLRAIDAEARRQGKRMKVLLQVHVAREETKFGFLPEALEALVNAPGFLDSLEATDIVGVMGMASNTDDMERVDADFAAIRGVFDSLRAGAFAGRDDFAILSMGMSHDFTIALKRGANMVRIGTDIFGEREY